MLNQARELKSKLDKAQEELNSIIVEGKASKGDVTVAMTGKQKIQSIKISPEVIDPARVERLENLVLIAVDDAITKSQKMAAKQLKGLTGGLKIPGIT
jgi:DNA-binding YbaB/EbfC family protein